MHAVQLVDVLVDNSVVVRFAESHAQPKILVAAWSALAEVTINFLRYQILTVERATPTNRTVLVEDYETSRTHQHPVFEAACSAALLHRYDTLTAVAVIASPRKSIFFVRETTLDRRLACDSSIASRRTRSSRLAARVTIFPRFSTFREMRLLRWSIRYLLLTK